MALSFALTDNQIVPISRALCNPSLQIRREVDVIQENSDKIETSRSESALGKILVVKEYRSSNEGAHDQNYGHVAFMEAVNVHDRLSGSNVASDGTRGRFVMGVGSKVLVVVLFQNGPQENGISGLDYAKVNCECVNFLWEVGVVPREIHNNGYIGGFSWDPGLQDWESKVVSSSVPWGALLAQRTAVDPFIKFPTHKIVGMGRLRTDFFFLGPQKQFFSCYIPSVCWGQSWVHPIQNLERFPMGLIWSRAFIHFHMGMETTLRGSRSSSLTEDAQDMKEEWLETLKRPRQEQ